MGWAWDPAGSAPAAKALQPGTSRGRRENSPKLPRGEGPNLCLRKHEDFQLRLCVRSLGWEFQFVFLEGFVQ